MKTHPSHSPDDTKALGASIAKKIAKLRPGKTARLIALRGDLGSGKTTFVQGFLRSLGYRGKITSPTFILMRHFKIRGTYRDIYHVDAYRIEHPKEMLPLKLHEILKNPKAIILVEWPEKMKTFMRGAEIIRFFHGKRESERSIKT